MVDKFAIQTDKSAVDVWTFVHLGAGFIMGRCGIPLLPTIALLVLYEWIENRNDGYVTKTYFGSVGPESTANIVGDLVAGIVGWVAGRSLV